MSTKIDLIIQMLNDRHEASEKALRLVQYTNFIKSLGPEGIIQTAQQDGGPELILQAVELLATMVKKQDEMLNDLTEKWLQSMEHTDGIVKIIESFREKMED